MSRRGALALAAFVALTGCTQQEGDRFADDVGHIILTLFIIALVVALVVVVLVAVGAGLLTRGLAGLRKKQPPPPPWPPPGAYPPPPGYPPGYPYPPPPPPPDDSRSWAYVIAGAALLLIVGPTFAQIFIGRGFPAVLVEVFVLAIVIGAITLIRRGPPTAQPPSMPPPSMPPPSMPPPAPPADPAPARPRRRAPLQAPGRDRRGESPRPPD